MIRDPIVPPSPEMSSCSEFQAQHDEDAKLTSQAKIFRESKHLLFNRTVTGKAKELQEKEILSTETLADARVTQPENSTISVPPPSPPRPARADMETGQSWLSDFVSSFPLEPSMELERLLSSCGAGIIEKVAHRARIILESIFSPSVVGQGYTVSGSPELWVQTKRTVALKVYYMFLEAICKDEALVMTNLSPQVVPSSYLTSLLANEGFHRSVLACSAELVLANTYCTYSIFLPEILNRAGITTFDLSMVIESFISHEELLPTELGWHLSSLKEILLESMIWEKGSSIYDSMVVARPQLSAEINSFGLLAEPMPSLNAIVKKYICGSMPPHKDETPGQNGDIQSPRVWGKAPSKRKFPYVDRRMLGYSPFESSSPPPPLQFAFASRTCPNPGGEGTCGETIVKIMFNKVLELADYRISDLCARLGVSREYEETVSWFVKRIIRRRTGLFFCRHIDQIILCSFYSIAKMMRLKLKFEKILQTYVNEPENSPKIFRSIYVDWSQNRHDGRSGEEYVGIATFYTKIFDPSVRSLLALKLAGVRIKELVNVLELTTQHMEETVYCFVQQIRRGQTSLFVGRDIDQIVLCSLYGVAKVLKLELTFEEIVNKYRKLPQSKGHIIRSVYVDWSQMPCNEEAAGQDHVDIVTFYQKVFAPSVKPLLMKLGSVDAGAGEARPQRVCPDANASTCM